MPFFLWLFILVIRHSLQEKNLKSRKEQAECYTPWTGFSLNPLSQVEYTFNSSPRDHPCDTDPPSVCLQVEIWLVPPYLATHLMSPPQDKAATPHPHLLEWFPVGDIVNSNIFATHSTCQVDTVKFTVT